MNKKLYRTIMVTITGLNLVAILLMLYFGIEPRATLAAFIANVVLTMVSFVV